RTPNSHRATVSDRKKKDARNSQAVYKNREASVVPGRTAKHGRMDFQRTTIAHALLQRNRLRGTRRRRQPGSRRTRPPQTRASPPGCRRVFGLSLLCADFLKCAASVVDDG